MKRTDKQLMKVKEYIDQAKDCPEFKELVGKVKAAVSKVTSIQATTKTEKTYELTYNTLFLAGGACLDHPTERNILMLMLGVYAWMPTVLKIDDVESSIVRVQAAIDHFKDNDDLLDPRSIGHFNNVATYVNHSCVGASKFLHFIFPEKFAIFDSKICENIRRLCGGEVNILNSRLFVEYPTPTQELKAFLLYELMVREIADDLVTDLRCVERIIFDRFGQR
jgi:hypothetical protein